MWLNALLIGILCAIVGGILLLLFHRKKKGQHCIGCPCAKSCSGNCMKKDGL